MASTDPRTATEAQWQDLATRVKAKADASSIPTVNNSTITVTNNGLDKGAFTTNQSSAGTVALDYPVITMTQTDPGEGSALAANNFIAVYGGDPIIMDYSTSEINTGAKWIDDSAIYKKTINFGALPNASTKAVAHNISGLSTIVNIEGVVLSGNVYQPLNFYDGASIRVAYVGATTVNFYTTNDQSGATAYITLYYTKSS